MEYPQQIVEWLDRYDANIGLIVPALEKVGTLNPDFIRRLKVQIGE